MSIAANGKPRRSLHASKARSGRAVARKKSENALLTLIDDLRAIGTETPPEEWAKLPADFNENLDHYLYGSPKKQPRKDNGRGHSICGHALLDSRCRHS